jgi:peroxiredoxin
MNVSAQVPAETIPDFNFVRLNKSSFTNKNLEQGKMLFFIFFDSECEHCQRTIQYVDQHYQDFKRAAIYLITLDNADNISRFMSKYGNRLTAKKNVTLLQDFKNEFIGKFGPRKYPSIFLYSTKKKLILYEDDEKSLPRFSKQINTPGR